MNRIERILFVPVSAIRPYLALKLTLGLLAFDIWITRTAHAGRYGAGGFNVAHFGWLDALQPGVSPSAYIIVCTLTGALCLTIAIASRPPWWLILCAFLLHTWSWAMSMLDSYQHHYLISLVLIALVFVPPISADDALEGPEMEGRKTSAWGYVVLSWSIALVYAYAAFAKTDDEWWSGAALQRVLHLPQGGGPPANGVDPIGPIRGLAESVLISGDDFWKLMGASVVLLQALVALGYVLAPFRDASKHWIVAAICWLALPTAIMFHLGAEYMSLQIGWFSWYMIGYALIFLLPGRWLVIACRLLLPVRRARAHPIVAQVVIGFGICTLLVAGVVFHNERALVNLSETGTTPWLIIGMAVLLLIGLGGVSVMVRNAHASTLAARGAIAVTLIGLGLIGDAWGENVTLTRLLGGETNIPMIVLGIVVLALTPLRVSAHLGDEDSSSRRIIAIGTAIVGALALGLVGPQLDLPGATTAGLLAGFALACGAVALLVMRDHARAIHAYAVGAIIAAFALLLCIQTTEVRWDYYRNVGGDHRRRLEYRESYEAYVKANQYAPPGEDRLDRQNQMEQELRDRGEW